MKKPRGLRRQHGEQYPMATVIPYGPDDTRATKLVAAVFNEPDRNAGATRRWTAADGDVRHNPIIAAELADFLHVHGAQETVTADRIMGCPHEEGIDYPLGRACPQCPFWAAIDRFTHEPLVVADATMPVDELLAALANDDMERVDDALASADAHRDALIAPLLAALERGILNPVEASDQEATLFSYALYMLARWRETRACPSVVRWLSLPGEGPFEIAGDIVTEHGGRILASVFDGDFAPIKTLVLNQDANEYCRAAGVTACALLAAWGEAPRQPIVDYFCWLAQEGLERTPSMTWDVLALSCVDIEAVEALPAVRRAYDEDIVDPGFMQREELDEAETARGWLLQATRDRYPPIDDVAQATAWWGGWGGQADDEESPEEQEEPDEVQEPYRAPPKIGRNQPCPCASGKKYKKCCGK